MTKSVELQQVLLNNKLIITPMHDLKKHQTNVLFYKNHEHLKINIVFSKFSSYLKLTIENMIDFS